MTRIFILILILFGYHQLNAQSLSGTFEVGGSKNFQELTFESDPFDRHIHHKDFPKIAIQAGLIYKTSRNFGVEAGLGYQKHRSYFSGKYKDPYDFKWTHTEVGSYTHFHLLFFYDIKLFDNFFFRPSVGIAASVINPGTMVATYQTSIDTLSVSIVSNIISGGSFREVVPAVIAKAGLMYQFNSKHSLTFNVEYMGSVQDFSIDKIEYHSKNTPFYELGLITNTGNRLGWRLGYNVIFHTFKTAEMIEPVEKLNIAYLEFAGVSDMLSLNYERILKQGNFYSVAVRAGAGLNILDATESYSLPLSINNIFGKGKSHAEFDIGYIFNKERLAFRNGWIHGDRIFTGFGYRFQKPGGGLFLKGMVYPSIMMSFHEEFEYWFDDTTIGVCTGWSF